MLRPIDKIPRSDQVFAQLRDNILTGTYEPGQKLPPERTICERMNVNRTSVREAVKRLQQAKLVQVRQGSGMTVRDYRLHAGLDLIGALLMPGGRLDPVALESVLEMRLLLGPELARLTAERGEPEEIARLGEVVERLERCAAEDAQGIQHHDFEFHSRLAEASRNLAYLLVVNSIKDLYREYAELFRPAFEAPFPQRKLYRRIVEAIRAGQPERAHRLDRELLSATNDRIRESLGL
jgi:DNA-binding FadR family transcriptional regulator